MTRSESRLDLPGLHLHLSEQGQGQPVLCLHGFPELGRFWWPLAQALRQEPVRLLMPDLRGCGASGAPADPEDYAANALVGDVLNLLDRLNLPQVHLLGHDWGGVLAWLVAQRHPERVRSLTACNAPHPRPFQMRLIGDPAQREASAYLTRLQTPGAGRALLAEGGAALWERLRGTPALGFDAEDRAAWLAHWARPEALDGAVAWYRCSAFRRPERLGDAVVDWHLDAAAWQVGVPTLIVWGEADSTFVPALAEESAALCRRAQVLRWRGIRHSPPREAPQALAQALARFWAAADLGESAIDVLFNTGTLQAIHPIGTAP